MVCGGRLHPKSQRLRLQLVQVATVLSLMELAPMGCVMRQRQTLKGLPKVRRVLEDAMCWLMLIEKPGRSCLRATVVVLAILMSGEAKPL
jgi:hypothetical protein